MRSLPRPTFSAEEVFRVCISRVRNRDLKARLEACVPEIIQDTLDFDSKAPVAKLHLIQRKTHVNGNVTKDEMEKVYTDRMVGKDGPGRSYYLSLRYPQGEDKCPFCGQRPSSTLDHYLAKTHYPSLVVSPTNLVPACKDCNFIKNHTTPTRSEEETLHPYFDHIEDSQWLFARVVQTNPASLHYFIQPPAHANPLQAERIQHHFRLYDLATLYSSEATSEMSDLSFQMRNLLNKVGPAAVRRHLTEIAESCFHNRRNSWKTAMYQALCSDDWYCSVGAGL